MANYIINIRGGSTGSINTGTINQIPATSSTGFQNLTSTTLGKSHDQTRYSRGATGIDVVKSNLVVPTKAINRRGKYVTLATDVAAAHSTVTLTLTVDTINKTILRLSGQNSVI